MRDRPLAAVFPTGTPKLLFFLEAAVIYAVLFFPAFLYAGLGFGPTYLIHTLAVTAFALTLTRLFFTANSLDSGVKHVMVVEGLKGFLPFLVFVFIQSFGGSVVFHGGLGSIAPFITFLHAQQLLCYVMLFVSFYAFFRTRTRVRMAGLTLGIQAVVLVAAGLYNSLTETQKLNTLFGVFEMSRFGTYYASFPNPNHYGGYLAVLQPLFLASTVYYWMSRDEEWKFNAETVEKIFLSALIVLSAVSCFMAAARGGLVWQGAMMALFFCGFFLRKPKAVFAIAICMAAVAAFVMLASTLEDLGKISQDLANRAVITRECQGMFRDFAPLGAGLGTSTFILSFYQRTGAENWSFWQPYNTVLQLLSETGIVGTVLFLVPTVFFASLALFRSVDKSSRWDRLFGLAAFVAVFTYLLPAMIDNYLATPAVAIVEIFYLALAGRCANGSFSPHADGRLKPPAQWSARSAAALIVAVWALWAVFCVRVSHDFRALSAVKASSKQLTALETATKLRPRHALTWMELGHWHYTQALNLQKEGKPFEAECRRSIEAYLSTVALAPTWHAAWRNLGKAEILLGLLERGTRHLDFSTHLNPYNRDSILYTLNMEVKLANAAIWPDEAEVFRSRAYYWVEAGSRLPRPLTASDCEFLMVWSTPLPEADRLAVSAFIAKYNLKKNPPPKT